MISSDAPGQLKKGSLGVGDIVFFVVAAAAPLGATLANAPIVYSLGGRGAPGLYLLASILLLFFAVGFATMSRYVISAGGFAELIARGLGQRAGHAAAGMALLAYACMLTGIFGQFSAYSSHLLNQSFGFHTNWRELVFLAVIAIGLFGYIDIDLSAKVLGVLMILEVLILILFDAAVLFQTPLSDIGVTGFRPGEIFSPGMSTALMFAFACFVGFESTTIYGEEARDPHRTVPLATYVAIGLIGIFYTLTMWCLGIAYAHVDVQKLATNDPVNFVLSANKSYVGAWATDLMQILVVTSVFAVVLSFHNTLCRYIFALARNRFLPSVLSRIHERHGSPHIASITLSIVTAAVIFAFIVAGADPIKQLFMWMVAVGTLGVLVLQAMAAISVIRFFVRRPEPMLWRGIIAPLIGGSGLILVVGLATTNFHLLSGTESRVIGLLPGLILLAAILGVWNGRKLVDN